MNNNNFPNAPEKDRLTFFTRAMKAQRATLLASIPEAMRICRTAGNRGVALNADGQAGLYRLVETWGGLHAGLLYLEGTPFQIMEGALNQIYTLLKQRKFDDPLGMAVYVEMNYMMRALIQGDWFE